MNRPPKHQEKSKNYRFEASKLKESMIEIADNRIAQDSKILQYQTYLVFVLGGWEKVKFS